MRTLQTSNEIFSINVDGPHIANHFINDKNYGKDYPEHPPSRPCRVDHFVGSEFSEQVPLLRKQGLDGKLVVGHL